MNKSKLGFICSECGHPISGIALRWKNGSPVCSCLSRFVLLKSRRLKPGNTILLNAAPSRRRWSWILLFVCAGIYLFLQ